MTRIKQAELRDTATFSAALAGGKASSSKSKSSRAPSPRDRTEQQRAGSRISGRFDTGAGEGLSSGGSRGAPPSGRPADGSFGIAAAADWGERERTSQQVSWWRGAPPKERSGSSGARSNGRGETRKG